MAEKIEEKEWDKEDVSCTLIIEMISKWIDLQNLVEKYYPDIVITNRTVNIFNDDVMAHLRKNINVSTKTASKLKIFIEKKNHPNANFTRA